MINNRDINKYVHEARNEYSRNGKSEHFNRICDVVYHNATIKGLISFASSVEGVDIRHFGKIVLEEGTAEDNFEFALINGADTRAHRDRIIKSRDIEINILAGKQINDNYREEYVNKHGAIVLQGTPYQNYKYIRHNKTQMLDKRAHLNKIIESGDLYINRLCAKDIEGADISAHAKVILASKSPMDNFAFAKINGADVFRHLDVVINYGGARLNFDALQEFKQCNELGHLTAIYNSEDNETKYDCLQWLKATNRIQQMRMHCVRRFIDLYNKGKISFSDLCGL